MAIVKKPYFSSSVDIRDEDAYFLSNEAKKVRRGIIPEKVHKNYGDNQECTGCPIWIRWACIKCSVCMYWVEEEEENY